MWDERGLVKGWLDDNLRLTDEPRGEYLWDERGLMGWLDDNLRLTDKPKDEKNQYLWVDVYRYER
jgi:hypothetical protein